MAWDHLAGIYCRRMRSQAICGDGFPPNPRPARALQQRIAGESVSVVGGFQVPIVKGVIEDVVLTFSKPRSSKVSAITSSGNSVRELSRAVDIKKIVVELRPTRPALPIGLQYKIYFLAFSHINSIVVDRRIGDGTGDVDAFRVVILADVVADNGSDVAHVFRGIVTTFIADQQEAAIVIVTVVVLNDCVAAVPVGVEALAVSLSMRSVDFVELHRSIVCTPRPDSNVVTL